MIKEILPKILFIFLIITVVSCTWMRGPSEQEDREAIKTLLTARYLKGWNEGDADMVANAFAKDATFQSKLRGLLKGREAIRQYIDVVLGYLAGKTVSLDIKKIEITGKDTAKAFVDISVGTRKTSKTLLMKRYDEGWLINHY